MPGDVLANRRGHVPVYKRGLEPPGLRFKKPADGLLDRLVSLHSPGKRGVKPACLFYVPAPIWDGECHPLEGSW